MQSEFLLNDNPQYCANSTGSKKNTNNNNNTYKVADKQNRKKTPGYNYRSNQTPRLDSANGLPDNLPGSSMSVADITLTMSNEESQNIVCLEQMTPPLDSGVEDDYLASSFLPLSPNQAPSAASGEPSRSIPRCFNPLCDSDTCRWHKCILKSPQLVRWMPNTVTIELSRSPHTKCFGFYTKAKEHLDKKSKELYVLVKEVQPGGSAALVGLAVGDYVRSVNYKALYTSQEYNKFVNSTLRNADKLMMVIQRPDKITIKDPAMLESLTSGQKSSIPLSKPLSPSTSPDVKFSPCSPSSEAIPLRPVVRSKLKSNLPQARLIVCGNRTNEFMRCFMGGFIHFPVDSHASYHHVSLESLHPGSVSVSNSESFSCMVRESSLDSINVDIISVASDNFFHHCCPWIFSPDSIFILTFDVKRLSQFSEVELARLSSLKHTVHANGSGSSGRLKLVGVVLPGEDVPLEEIRTLFYTSLGETLPGPDFVSISGNIRTKEMQRFQAEILRSVTEISSQSEVAMPVLKAMDCLISHQNLTITNQELSAALMNLNLRLDTQLLNTVIDDLKRTGNLLSTCHLPQSGTMQELIIPSKLFDCLIRITMSTDRIQIPIPSSGIIPRVRLLKSLEDLTSDPIKLLTCLEDLGVVYAVQVKGRDSGFCEEVGVIFPYLLEEVSFDIPSDGYHDILTIKLSDPVAFCTYQSWLSKLSGHCQRFEMLGQTVARFLMEGIEFTCTWNRVQNHISLVAKGPAVQPSKTSGYSLQLQRVESNLLTSLVALRSPFQFHWSENRSHRDSREVGLDSMGDEGERYIRGQILLGHNVGDFLPLLGALDNGGEEPEAVRLLMDCAIVTVPYITSPLQQLYRHLSIDNSWETLAAHLGQTTKQIRVFGALVVANPNRLPAETFYLHFTHETFCSLGDILSGLLQMAGGDPQCQSLAEKLMRAAINGYNRHRNSP